MLLTPVRVNLVSIMGSVVGIEGKEEACLDKGTTAISAANNSLSPSLLHAAFMTIGGIMR